MKLILRLVFLLCLVFAGAVIFKLMWPHLPSLLFGQVQTYTSVLQKVKEESLQELETLRITNEYVFPYDFIEKPYPDSWSVLSLKNPALYRNKTEKFNINFYELMKKIDIDLAKEAQSFLILRADIRIGFDLTNQGDWILAKNLPEGVGVEVRLPQPSILAFVLEIETQKPGWPSMNVGPESWSLLSSFLEKEIRNSILNTETLALAKSQAEHLLTSTLKQAGFRNVEFTY